MIEEDDEWIDSTEVINEQEELKVKEITFDENQLNKLMSSTKLELINIYQELNEYILSLNENIKRGTSTVYLSYNYGKNFIELWFQVNSLKYVIMTGDYDDPKGLVVELAESYKWTNDRCIFVNLDSDIEYIKNILKQSFEKQFNR